MAVYLELGVGDTLVIGNSRITVDRKSGQRTRLRIDSTEDVERIKAGDPVPRAAQQVAAPQALQRPAPPRQAASGQDIRPILQRPDIPA